MFKSMLFFLGIFMSFQGQSFADGITSDNVRALCSGNSNPPIIGKSLYATIQGLRESNGDKYYLTYKPFENNTFDLRCTSGAYEGDNFICTTHLYKGTADTATDGNVTAAQKETSYNETDPQICNDDLKPYYSGTSSRKERLRRW